MKEELIDISKNICKENNLWPQKQHGQNFLIIESAYESIIAVAELKSDDVVLEVGPGLGFLTERLAKIVKKVITVEIDKNLCDFLPSRFKSMGLSNIELINDDILHLSQNIAYNKIVANLPYNISAKFLRSFLAQRNAPEIMVLMLQKEVVERICARPPKMSILAVSVQYYAHPRFVEFVPKEAFWPQPKVDSAIVKIVSKVSKVHKVSKVSKVHKVSKVSELIMGEGGDEEKGFFQLVKIGFASRRKMLKNNLASGFRISQAEAEAKLEQAGISRTARAQELSMADWGRLLETLP